MNENFGSQHVNTLIFRALSDIETDKRTFRKGEAVLYLRDAEIFSLETQHASAASTSRVPLVRWFTPTDMRISVRKGTISSSDLAILLDSGIIEATQTKIGKREEKMVGHDGKITLDRVPIPKTVFCYYDGEMIFNTPISDKTVILGSDFAGEIVTVDYCFMSEKALRYKIGENVFSNRHFEIEAHFEYKSEDTGEEYTGVFTMPCANVVGEANFLLGRNVSPVVGNLACYFVEPKTRERGQKEFCSISFLREDLEAL